MRFPFFFRHHEFRPNSGGDGQYVGGAGGELEFVVETDEPCVANTAGDGVRHGPVGMMGGKPGLPHRYRMRAPGRRPVVLDSKHEGIPVPPGTVFEVHAAGGGGWGDPARRTDEDRRSDRRDGFVTARGR